MPGPSIESANSTSTWNVGNWSQKGFVKGIKITAFVFLMLLSRVDYNQRMTFTCTSNYLIFKVARLDFLGLIPPQFEH